MVLQKIYQQNQWYDSLSGHYVHPYKVPVVSHAPSGCIRPGHLLGYTFLRHSYVPLSHVGLMALWRFPYVIKNKRQQR
jgi:hypothetical protein